jgi:hypothetical protein
MNWIDKNSKNIEKLYKTSNLDVVIFNFYPRRTLTKPEKQKMLKNRKKSVIHRTKKKLFF